MENDEAVAWREWSAKLSRSLPMQAMWTLKTLPETADQMLWHRARRRLLVQENRAVEEDLLLQ